jgi:hypothetical protein
VVAAARAQVSRAERSATTAAQWRRQLIDLFADDHGLAVKLITAGQLELASDNTYDLPAAVGHFSSEKT